MNRFLAILLLLNFMLFIIPINTEKSIAKQFMTSMPAEEEHGSSKGLDINELGVKLLHPVRHYNFSGDIFYLLTKEHYSHYILHVFPVDWLETFSPPPDRA